MSAAELSASLTPGSRAPPPHSVNTNVLVFSGTGIIPQKPAIPSVYLRSTCGSSRRARLNRRLSLRWTYTHHPCTQIPSGWDIYTRTESNLEKTPRVAVINLPCVSPPPPRTLLPQCPRTSTATPPSSPTNKRSPGPSKVSTAPQKSCAARTRVRCWTGLYPFRVCSEEVMP